MAQNEVEVDVGGGGSKGGLSMGKIVVILVALQFMLVVVLGGALYFAGVFDSNGNGADSEERAASETRSKPVGDPVYIKMEPPFTVNFSGRGGARFMQVTIELMTYDKAAEEAVARHNPVLRNQILRTLGGKEEEDVRSVEGKDRLQQEVLEAVRRVMEERYGKEAIEEVYFTSFVIQ